MRIFVAAAVAAGLAAVAAPALAETQVGVGYTNLDAGGTSLGSVDATVTWDTASLFGLEAQGGVGVKSDGSGATKVKENWNLAGFATVRAPINDMFSLRARAGYGWVDVKNAGVSDTSNGFAGGVGAQLMFNEANGVRADYTYQKLDNGHANDWSVQLVHKF